MNAAVPRIPLPAPASLSGNPLAVVKRGLRNPEIPLTRDEVADVRSIIDAAVEHRVMVLLGTRLRSARALERWPPAFREAFSVAEREAVMLEWVRQLELRRVLDALGAANVRALLFKGAALAQVQYPAPHLRGRTDADILVRHADLPALESAVQRLDYERQHETSGDLVSYQSHYGRHDRYGVFHALDVHWKISNRHAFADRLEFGELWEERLAVPALGPNATTVSGVHALLLAIIHRAAHHPGSTNLLWIYDLHLLASGMSASELQRLVDLAASKGLSRLAHDGLRLASDAFGTPGLEPTIRALRRAAPTTDSARVIPERWRQAGIVRRDLQALTTWNARVRLVREHLFPSPRYIRGKYGFRSPLLLPALYAWRIVSGAPRWLRRHDDGG